MPTAILDPSSDVSTQWEVAPTGTLHWQAVLATQASSREPNTPGDPDDQSDIHPSGQVQQDIFGFENLDVPSYTATQVLIKFFYESTPQGELPVGLEMFVQLDIGGSSPGQSFSLSVVNDETWQTATFNGSWTKTQLDAMQARMATGGTDPSKGGAIWIIYAVVTYTVPAIADTTRSHGYIF